MHEASFNTVWNIAILPWLDDPIMLKLSVHESNRTQDPPLCSCNLPLYSPLNDFICTLCSLMISPSLHTGKSVSTGENIVTVNLRPSLYKLSVCNPTVLHQPTNKTLLCVILTYKSNITQCYNNLQIRHYPFFTLAITDIYPPNDYHDDCLPLNYAQ